MFINMNGNVKHAQIKSTSANVFFNLKSHCKHRHRDFEKPFQEALDLNRKRKRPTEEPSPSNQKV